MTLELRSLCKQVDSENHLQDISLTFQADSFNVLLGPARSGKTSILRSIAGLDNPGSGSIHLHGEDITSLAVRKRDIAFVYQEFVNYPTLSVFENIASPLRVRREQQSIVEATVLRIADLLGIADLLERRPPSLSGGQQQRVAIARALTKDANVVLLDEPLANLDYRLREDLRRDLPRIFEGRGKIVLYAATDPDEAFLLGSNTVVLHEGKVTQTGLAADIFAAPVDTIAATVLSEFPINLMPASFDDDSFDLGNGFSLPAPSHARSLPAGHYTLGIRAEHFSLAAQSSESASCDAAVTITESTGNETIVHMQLADHPCVGVVGGSQSFETRQPTRFHIDLGRLFVFDLDGRTVASPGAA